MLHASQTTARSVLRIYLLAGIATLAGCGNTDSSDENAGTLVLDTNPPGAVLDGAFGAGSGRILLSANESEAVEIVEDANGNLVIAGTIIDGAGDMQVAVWRLLPNGDLDGSFGTGGTTIIDVSTASPDQDSVVGMAIDGAGKIVVAGTADGTGGDRDIFVARLFSDGLIDLGFGSGGDGVVYAGNDATMLHDDTAADLIIGIGGSIQVIGNSRISGTTDIGELASWRFLNVGLIDNSFASGGLFLSGTNGDRGAAVLNDLSGLSYLIGSRGGSLTIWRLLATGALDAGFSAGGISTIPAPAGSLVPFAATVYDNISFMVVGRRTESGITDRFFATRLFIDGTLETAFGVGGFLSFASFTGDSGANSLSVAPSGQVITAGVTTLRDATTAANSPAGAMWLITAAGFFDPILAGGGVAHLSSANDSGTTARSVTVDSLNRLVVAGSVDLGTGTSTAVVWRTP